MHEHAARPSDDGNSDGFEGTLEGFRISLISPPYNTHMRTPVRITYRILRPDENGFQLY
jgi:hypothetical protein